MDPSQDCSWLFQLLLVAWPVLIYRNRMETKAKRRRSAKGTARARASSSSSKLKAAAKKQRRRYSKVWFPFSVLRLIADSAEADMVKQVTVRVYDGDEASDAEPAVVLNEYAHEDDTLKAPAARALVNAAADGKYFFGRGKYRKGDQVCRGELTLRVTITLSNGSRHEYTIHNVGVISLKEYERKKCELPAQSWIEPLSTSDGRMDEDGSDDEPGASADALTSEQIDVDYDEPVVGQRFSSDASMDIYSGQCKRKADDDDEEDVKVDVKRLCVDIDAMLSGQDGNLHGDSQAFVRPASCMSTDDEVVRDAGQAATPELFSQEDASATASPFELPLFSFDLESRDFDGSTPSSSAPSAAKLGMRHWVSNDIVKDLFPLVSDVVNA